MVSILVSFFSTPVMTWFSLEIFVGHFISFALNFYVTNFSMLSSSSGTSAIKYLSMAVRNLYLY